MNSKSDACKWFSICPMKRFHESGRLAGKWIDGYCLGDWTRCVRYALEAEGRFHPDWMLPDGTLDPGLSESLSFKERRRTMLQTGLKHLQSEEELRQVLRDHENVMICCGRMGPMCIPVYKAMEQLQPRYPHVAFRDLEFDIPAANFVKGLPQCASFMGLPFTVYFKGGEVAAATSSIQSMDQIRDILNRAFGPASDS